MLFNSAKKTPHDAKQQIADAQKILETIRPLSEKLHSSIAMRFVSGGFHLIEELLYYLLALACFIFMFILDSVFPFHLLGEIVNRPVFREQISNTSDIQSFNFAVRALVALIGLLFMLLALKKSGTRKKNALLHTAGTEIRKMEQYFSEKVRSLEKVQSEQAIQDDTDPVEA